MAINVVAGREPGDDHFSHAEGHENAGAIAANRSLEVGGSYADDGEGVSIHEQSLANHVG